MTGKTGKISVLARFCKIENDSAHWASYVVGGITQLKVKILLDFAKSQIAEENSKVCASDL